MGLFLCWAPIEIIQRNWFNEQNPWLRETYHFCYGRKHGFVRGVGLLLGRAVPYAFITKKNFWTNRSQSVINTENGEKRNLKQFKHLNTPQMSEGAQNRKKPALDSLKTYVGVNPHDRKNALARWRRFHSWTYPKCAEWSISLMEIYLVQQKRCL